MSTYTYLLSVESKLSGYRRTAEVRRMLRAQRIDARALNRFVLARLGRLHRRISRAGLRRSKNQIRHLNRS